MDPRCDLHALAADAVVQEDGSVLLVRLASAPDGREGWRLPGALLDHGEHPEACIRRVLKALVGLEPDWLTLTEIESVPGEVWHLRFHYRCEANHGPVRGAGVREARFFQLEHLPQTANGPWEREVIYRVITS